MSPDLTNIQLQTFIIKVYILTVGIYTLTKRIFQLLEYVYDALFYAALLTIYMTSSCHQKIVKHIESLPLKIDLIYPPLIPVNQTGAYFAMSG